METSEGLAPLQGVEVSISDEEITPQEGFNRIENVQIHESGSILEKRPLMEHGTVARPNSSSDRQTSCDKNMIPNGAICSFVGSKIGTIAR